MTLNSGLEVTQGIQTGIIQKHLCGFLFSSHSIWLYLVSFLRQSEIYCSKIVIFIHPCTRRRRDAREGGSRRSIAISFGTEKPECWGYLMVRNFHDMFSDVNRIPACDRQTDGQTCCDGVVLAMHTRGAVKTRQL